MNIKIPLKDGTEMEVPSSWIAEWGELYFKDDIQVQLLKCRIWNLERPQNRKTKTGLKRHIGHFMKDCRIKPQVRMIAQQDDEPKPEVSKETRVSAIQQMKAALAK